MSDPAHEIRLITTHAGLDELLGAIREEGRFAFDTEFVSEDTFEPVLCLVQVAIGTRLAAIDPLALRDLSGFWEVVNDPDIEVVMHAAGEDLRICQLQTGRVPPHVFDVQIAAGMVGLGYPLSLGNVVGQVVQSTVYGGETRTDWRKRPLTDAQVRYAVDDVRYLLPVAERLEEWLRDLGRLEWARDEFRSFLEDVESRADGDRWRRLSGLQQLSRRGLESARRLFDWRLEEARRQNRPMRQVLRDDLLIAIAKRQPKTRADLEALRDFNRPHLLARSQQVLATIAAALEIPQDALPELPERHDDGPGLTMLVNLLAAAMANCCAQARVANALCGSASDLRDLVRWHASGCPESRRPHLARGWRREICGDTLLDVLRGDRALRVTDPESDVPVAVERIPPETSAGSRD